MFGTALHVSTEPPSTHERTAQLPVRHSPNLDDATIARFQKELGAMGYKVQFVTLAGFHALNFAMYELATGYRDRGMAAYSQDR